MAFIASWHLATVRRTGQGCAERAAFGGVRLPSGKRRSGDGSGEIPAGGAQSQEGPYQKVQ